MSKSDLKLDWCSHAAAKYAVEHWHYSKSMPAGTKVRVGVWERDVFIGVLIFSSGSTINIGSPYGLKQIEVCELTRVALNHHVSAVSRILAIALKMVSRQSIGLKLVVSYADQNKDHHGGIYQASNWVYVGESVGASCLEMTSGEVLHRRSAFERYGTSSVEKLGATRIQGLGKHKYLYPLTPEMQGKIEPLRKPYPKRAIAKGSPQSNADNGGAVPTRSLQPLAKTE